MTQPPHRLRSRDHVRRNHTPIRASPAAPYDLTILTVLRDGRHLWFSNIVREGDDPERMTVAHCAVRKLYHDADLRALHRDRGHQRRAHPSGGAAMRAAKGDKVLRAAIYARFSTDKQDKTSIDRQVHNCELMAKQRGFTVVATYKDEGISGNDRTRPGYQQLRAALDAGKIDVVLADETSRVSRDPTETMALAEEMEFRRQYLVTRDGVDTRSESAKMVLSMKAVVDQMESRKIGTRVYGSLRKQFEMGFAVGGKPYGYRLIESGNYPRSFLQIDKQQARVVVRIFESRAEGMSERAIASELNGGSAEPRSKSETHGAAHGRQVDALDRASHPPEPSVSGHPGLESVPVGQAAAQQPAREAGARRV